jgi:ribonuclease P protein component
MKRNFRLTHTKDFKRVKSEGETQKNRYAVLLYRKNEFEESRVAVVASKKVGNAVKRNRVKRVMRACINDLWNEIEAGWDLIFYSRAASSTASYDDLKTAIKDLLNQANLIIL